MAKNSSPSSFDVIGFLTQRGPKRTVSKYRANQILYSQGDPADSVFYIHKGKVKVTVTSEHGKEAVVAIRGPDEFCGEQAMTGMPLRLSSAAAMTECDVIRLDNAVLARLLRFEPEFADYFLFHLLTRTARVEADLVDQLFSSSEMRLARTLLLLANYGGDIGPEPIPIKVNHDLLAKMIGTTRSRVTVFMNKFRKLGLIDYNGTLKVQKALLNFVLHDERDRNKK
jgi:CRP-like cAMP-binding protein